MVSLEPEEAKKTLAELLRRHKGDTVAAAKEVNVSRKTFDRWLTRLELLGRAREIRAKVREKETKP